MDNIYQSIVAMPHSSMWWPIILGGAWCLFCLWPRFDGGGIPYVIFVVASVWFSLGPVVFVWVVWALIVAWN